MPFDPSRVDLLLQFALLIAGEEDEYIDRDLGPIHLIKYVYLADLAYARRNEGKTFTGVDWQFYKFGPWAQTVNERIEPALQAIGANKQTFASDYENKDDWVRWRLQDDRLLREREQNVPAIIATHLKREIHKFGKDTPSLLDYVYITKPMLAAAPNEYLDFTLAVEDKLEIDTESRQLRMDNLSIKQQKKFGERMRALRGMKKSREPNERRIVNPVKAPRYDEVYNEGIAWLDDLAGPQMTTGEKLANFADDVWKSPSREGDDVS